MQTVEIILLNICVLWLFSLLQLFEISVPLTSVPELVPVKVANHTGCKCLSTAPSHPYPIIRRSIEVTEENGYAFLVFDQYFLLPLPKLCVQNTSLIIESSLSFQVLNFLASNSDLLVITVWQICLCCSFLSGVRCILHQDQTTQCL